MVNGREVTFNGDPTVRLLYVLRNDLDLKGTRYGCGAGDCGACMVLVDGRPANACDLAVEMVAGKEVTSIEGLALTRLGAALIRAFTDHQAGQCGYCLSGILVSAAALLASDPAPKEPTIRQALDRHLCRCGSHQRIVRAIAGAAQELASA
jgi:nicotinate dehydrogenase subunit A